jgi:hypothetical protein
MKEKNPSSAMGDGFPPFADVFVVLECKFFRLRSAPVTQRNETISLIVVETGLQSKFGYLELQA